MLPPPRHDSTQQTRERLLDSAELLFAEQGYACTSVRDITRHAGCNVAAVNYHFGGKLNLYGEMFRRRLSGMRDRRVASVRLAALRPPGVDALEDVLRSFATAFMEPLLKEGGSGHIIELIAREILDPQLPPDTFGNEIFGPVRDALAEALGAVTPGLGPLKARLCVFSVLSQLIQAARWLRHPSLGEGVDGTFPGVDAVIDHIIRFSTAGVMASRDGRP